MLGEVAVAALDLRVVPRGVHDRGTEVIEHDPVGDAPEELEGRAVQT
jgi:hypothetical protein